MEADAILAITKCGDLFPYGEDKVKAAYKELAKKWHPDTNHSSEALEVFVKITRLYQEALRLLEIGQWEKTNYILLHTQDGKKIGVNYDACFGFELGTCYVARTKIIYVIGADKEKYYNNAIQRIRSLRYQDRRMEKNLKRCIPHAFQTFKTSGGEYVIMFDKTEDVYPLQCVYEYFDCHLDHRHVAWIISRLCNLTCYLKFNGLVHNGIQINNCFISPRQHSIFLPGGWWYAAGENERMIGTTKEVFSVMPVSAKSAKKASAITDSESVKLLGRQLLGETNCRKLALDDLAPKPFINFLTGGSGSDAYEEFVKWDKALIDSYGKRKFIKMDKKIFY